jgi:hypothetical protein
MQHQTRLAELYRNTFQILKGKKKGDVFRLPPSETMGLIWGDILGLSAGLTSTLLDILPRFLLRLLESDLRAADVTDVVESELRAVELGVILGCILAEAGAEPDGVLSGPILGVFLAENLGVPSGLDASSSDLVELYRVVVADSGSVRSSSTFSCRYDDAAAPP